MCLEIRKFNIDDGCDIYKMLQELPAEENGGNVGYTIRPSARNRGLGKQLLSHFLD